MQPDHGRSSTRHSLTSTAARRMRRAKRRRTPRARATRFIAVASLALSSAVAGVFLAFHAPGLRADASTTPVPLLGASIQNKASLAQETAQFGRLPIVRVYYKGLPDANAWTTGLAAANNSPVIVSFKALPNTILSGADDAVLRHFFDTAPRSYPIYWSYFHEPEDNIAAGQFTLAGYKAAWAYIAKIADAANNPQLHSTLILMSYDLVKGSHRDWRDYLPGGGIISTLGWDAYPQGSATNNHPILQAPSVFMGPAIAASKSVGLPYGFPEFGLSTPNGRAGWLAEVGQYLLHSGALFASLWDGNATYPTLHVTEASSIAVWRSYVAESRDSPTVAWVPPTPPTPVTPVPTPKPTVAPPPPAPLISGLTLSAPQLKPTSQAGATATFKLGQAANVTVCVLNAHGTVVHMLAKPNSAAGRETVSYLGSTRLASGQYTVLVVASNSAGSGTAEASFTLYAPPIQPQPMQRQ